MSASASSDSESGGEENSTREANGIESPRSEPQSRSSSPSPQSPKSSQSPKSPQSPSSPQSSRIASPVGDVGSPASSPVHSNPSSPNDRASSPQSREALSPSPPPQSPLSVNDQDLENDVQASDVEMSENEEDVNANGDQAVTKDNEDDENDVSHEADKEEEAGSQSEAEMSEHEEENAAEVSIGSADENEEERQSEKANSDSEMEQDKEDQESVHVASDKSDDEDEIPADEQTPSSPVQEDKEAEVRGKNKPESDAEENADSDSEGESGDESEVGGLIADIFGDSDDDEEFEGFKEEDIASGKTSKESTPRVVKKEKKRALIVSDSEDEAEDKGEGETAEAQVANEDALAPAEDESEVPEEEPPKKKKKVESDDSDDDDTDRKMREDFVSDFDIMMQKKKEESSKRRRRRDVDLISDSDDLIADIIAQMRQAAEDDKDLNKLKRTATKKLKILPMVMSQLKKQDLKTAFLDQGVLNVIAEWLTPLPDRSLPHLNIREGMLKQLSDLPPFDQSLLKSSGIGRALMYLYKHPRETKENREKAGKLITEWARPIFNVTTNYHSLTKEEREQRDYDHVPTKRRNRDQDEDAEEPKEKRTIENDLGGEKAIRPGDKGWISRARVPMPSNKDYVNRPKWNVEMEFGRGPGKKPLTRIEKHMRTLQDKKRQGKQQRAITISIEGRKMAI